MSGIAIVFGAALLGVAAVAALARLRREGEMPSSAVELVHDDAGSA